MIPAIDCIDRPWIAPGRGWARRSGSGHQRGGAISGVPLAGLCALDRRHVRESIPRMWRRLGACPSIERILLAKDERVGFHLPHEQDIPRLED
jgi:hypothetical protein